jgi:PPOX class probable F420-dependent enzyme
MGAKLSDPLVQELLSGRYVATLGTVNPDGSPHLVSVWFLCEGECCYIATASRSRKARNIKDRPRSSLMIDSRDPAASRGVTVSGPVRILTGDESRRRNAQIHRQYLSEAAIADSRIGPVFAQWDDVTLELRIEQVYAWDMREADRQAFGNAFRDNPGYLLPLER